MSLLPVRHELGEFKKRYKWMALVVLLVFGVLLARMIQLQLIEHREWAKLARDNITKRITLPATRGIIRDVDGRVVADNRPAYSVYITPQLLDPEHDIARIAELMGLSTEQRKDFEQRLEDVPRRRRTHQIEMFTDISRKQLAALETHQSSLPGVDVVSKPLRQYPFDSLGAHAIGYLNEISAKELKKRRDRGYKPGDRIGRNGIERAWESYLRGRPGFYRVTVDAQGHRLHDAPAETFGQRMRKEPVPGSDLTLTLDMGLMKAIRSAFRGHPSGGAVVLEVDTGKVRALFSKPAYDLNDMSGGISGKRLRELRENPFRPLIDKTVYETYFPGSTFKPIAAIAAVEDGVLDPGDAIRCPGYYELGRRRFHCTRAHGEVDLHDALVRSCNVYFYRLGQQAGIDRLARYARELGLGSPTGIGINSETSGFIATRDWYIERWGEPYRLGLTLNAAIGQGNTRATLLQMALAYSAIANGGKLYVPLLVERVNAPDGTVLERFESRVRRTADVSPEVLDRVRSGLVGVVNERQGTAYDARIEGGVRIAGKTGTAEVASEPDEDSAHPWYYRRDHAWFVGLAPADDPELVAVVIVEHGGSGGKTAAPIGIQVLEDYAADHGPKKASAESSSQGSVLASTEEP